MPYLIGALLLITLLSVQLARGMAIRRGRNRIAWMLSVALFPPLILALAVLPARPPHGTHSTA